MHSIHDALQIILEHPLPATNEIIPLRQSRGRVLAEDIYAPANVPSFSQSAVDGFAIKYHNYIPNTEWLVTGEIKAGDKKVHKYQHTPLYSNALSCIKIFTGAFVPKEYDAIVMKEYAQPIRSDIVKLDAPQVNYLQNIRQEGEEVKKGEIVFHKYTTIQPEHMAVLASIGITNIKVIKKPSVKIIATGNELKTLHTSKIRPGEKYESNGLMLQHLLQKYFGIKASYSIVKDKEEAIYRSIKKALQTHDIIITTGGISVGEYDFVKSSIQRLNYHILIDKVAQKPGKPMVFAVQKNKVIFGLPGNPRASLTCFYWYILRYLRKYYTTTYEQWLYPILQLPIDKTITIKDHKARILFANICNNKIHIPEKQDSHMLISAAKADGIVLIEKSVHQNELVDIYLLP